jgi:hypothetical protein
MNSAFIPDFIWPVVGSYISGLDTHDYAEIIDKA